MPAGSADPPCITHSSYVLPDGARERPETRTARPLGATTTSLAVPSARCLEAWFERTPRAAFFVSSERDRLDAQRPSTIAAATAPTARPASTGAKSRRRLGAAAPAGTSCVRTV